MSPRLSHLVPLAILLLVAGAACARSDTSAPTSGMFDSTSEAKVAAPVRGDAIMSRASREAPAASPPAPSSMTKDMAQGAIADASLSQPSLAGSSMIIRNGVASVEVDSLERAIAAVQRIASALGGYVGSTSLSAGDQQVRSATIELRIPSARYDDALAGLNPLGKVENISSNAQDVGEEFVDLSARTANARRLEERLITLLATRTGKLEDVLNVERELARVREEIERYDGRLRYLRARVATSTLSVTVHERIPLVSPNPGENVIGEAFKDAWRNFVHFLAALIASLGTIIPVALLAGVGALAWRRYRPQRVVALPGVSE